MINNIQTKLYFLSLSFFIILIDQFTKYLIFYQTKDNYKIYSKIFGLHSFYIFVSFIYYLIISIRIEHRFKSFKFV